MREFKSFGHKIAAFVYFCMICQKKEVDCTKSPLQGKLLQFEPCAAALWRSSSARSCKARAVAQDTQHALLRGS